MGFLGAPAVGSLASSPMCLLDVPHDTGRDSWDHEEEAGEVRLVHFPIYFMLSAVDTGGWCWVFFSLFGSLFTCFMAPHSGDASTPF